MQPKIRRFMEVHLLRESRMHMVDSFSTIVKECGKAFPLSPTTKPDGFVHHILLDCLSPDL